MCKINFKGLGHETECLVKVRQQWTCCLTIYIWNTPLPAVCRWRTILGDFTCRHVTVCMKTDICNQCTFHREGDNWGDVLLVSLFVRDKYTGLRSVCAVCSSWHQHWASMNAECEGRSCEDNKTHHQTIGHFIDPLCIFISSVTNHKHSYGNTFLENKKKKKKKSRALAR